MTKKKTSIWILVIIFLSITFGCNKKAEEEVRNVQKIDDSRQVEASQVQALSEDATYDDIAIPDQSVSGKLMGHPFNPHGFEISDAGQLEIWVGDRIFSDAKVSIVLCLRNNESPAGRTYEFHPGENSRYCPSIVLSRKSESGIPDRKPLQDEYSLKLLFGEPREHMLSGRIFLSVPGEDTEFAGVFHVAEPEDPAQPPEEQHRPYVYGRIVFSPPSTGILTAGYAGIGIDGKIYTNSAGLTVEPGESLGGGMVTSTTFKPRNTTMWTDKNGIRYFRHVHLEPGAYVFAVLWEGKLIFHRWLKVEIGSTIRLHPNIDLNASGTLVVETPNRRVTETQAYRQQEPVWLLPLDSSAGIPIGIDENKIWRISFGLQIKPEDEVYKLTYRFLAPGSYQVRFKDQVETVEVTTGEQAKARFP